MDDAAVARACTIAGLEAGRAIRALVHGMDPVARERVETSVLKPTGGYGARHVDAAAEALGLEHLERLSRTIDCAIDVLVDPATPTVHRVGAGSRRLWASMDAIDGTVKVAGLGTPRSGRVRLGNDGGWAAAFAFTAPTDAPLDALTFGDFTTATVVDGNPTRWRVYPQDLVVRPGAGELETWEASDGAERRVHTGTSTELGQSFVYLDVFQAHDTATRQPGDAALGVALFELLSNRHAGGAFDVLRQYANLSALGRMLFGWREPPVWVESQGAAYLVVNENIPNLIPSVPLVLGAGGRSVDFDGRPLAARRLRDGRTSVLHAANEVVCAQVLALVAAARRRAAR